MKTNIVGIVLAFTVTTASAQSLGEIAKKAAAKAADDKAASKPAPKVYTDKDLKPDPGTAKPVVLEPVVIGTDAASQSALTALRAVQSVLDGGANATEFKKYYLEAKVKVDALPNTPASEPLRIVSALYRDAVTLSIAYQTREMSGFEVTTLKQQYATDYEFLEFFNKIPNDGFSRRSFMTSNEIERATIEAQAASQILLVRAAQRLHVMK